LYVIVEAGDFEVIKLSLLWLWNTVLQEL